MMYYYCYMYDCTILFLLCSATRHKKIFCCALVFSPQSKHFLSRKVLDDFSANAEVFRSSVGEFSTREKISAPILSFTLFSSACWRIFLRMCTFHWWKFLAAHVARKSFFSVFTKLHVFPSSSDKKLDSIVFSVCFAFFCSSWKWQGNRLICANFSSSQQRRKRPENKWWFIQHESSATLRRNNHFIYLYPAHRRWDLCESSRFRSGL